MNPAITIRPIEAGDNAQLAIIIRAALTEFGADKPGTVYYDASTDHLYELFQTAGSAYHVALINQKVVGGGGIFPTEGLPNQVCELVKMYLAPEARGLGIGKRLLLASEATAVEMGYSHLYLETMPELTLAVGMYENNGFLYLTEPMGNSGHGGCGKWMLKQIT